jgi:hypothetical protein
MAVVQTIFDAQVIAGVIGATVIAYLSILLALFVRTR